MGKLWDHLFLEERPSIGLSFFRLSAALTVGLHVIPSFFCLADNYYHSAFKILNSLFFPAGILRWVQQSPEGLVNVFVAVFCVSWLFFLLGLFSQISGIVMVLSCYYFYALNSFPIGTLSWDILLVTLFLLCLTPYPGDYFSLDALRSGDALAYRRKRPFFVQSLLQMQLAATFFYTGLYKVTAAGNWVTGNPFYYLMNYPPEGVMKTFLLKDFLAAHAGLCYFLGLGIVVFEMSLPFFLYLSRTRRSAIYAGFLFHVVLILTMDVPAIFFFLFPAQLLLFIPPEDILDWVERKRAMNRKAGRHVLIYDGHCVFCCACVQVIKVMDLFDAIQPVDYQTFPDIGALHPRLTREICDRRIHLVESDGSVFAGFPAVRRLCFHLPMLFPMLLVVYFPGSGVLGPLAYEWVSRHRYLFIRGPACADNRCTPNP